jgi:hypothetical protein
MALPNGAGGYQLGDGNLSEVVIGTQAAPTAIAAAAVLTAAQLANGLIVFNGAAGALTVPTGALLDAAFTSMKVDSSFDFSIINTDAADAATVTASTGCTLVGVAIVATTSSCTWRARKTGDATYVFYRIAG